MVSSGMKEMLNQGEEAAAQETQSQEVSQQEETAEANDTNEATQVDSTNEPNSQAVDTGNSKGGTVKYKGEDRELTEELWAEREQDQMGKLSSNSEELGRLRKLEFQQTHDIKPSGNGDEVLFPGGDSKAFDYENGFIDDPAKAVSQMRQEFRQEVSAEFSRRDKEMAKEAGAKSFFDQFYKKNPDLADSKGYIEHVVAQQVAALKLSGDDKMNHAEFGEIVASQARGDLLSFQRKSRGEPDITATKVEGQMNTNDKVASEPEQQIELGTMINNIRDRR